MPANAIEKTLSPNDSSETGAHQAGMLIPKGGDVLSFFPKLDAGEKNPRAVVEVTDDVGHGWKFYFIYYNNRRFGGTRNEYRLTGMTAYLREFNLKAGDAVVLRRDSEGAVRIAFRRAQQGGKLLKLSTTWKVVDAGF